MDTTAALSGGLTTGAYRPRLSRQQICDLLIALDAVMADQPGATRWIRLHDLIRKQLEELDEKNGVKL